MGVGVVVGVGVCAGVGGIFDPDIHHNVALPWFPMEDIDDYCRMLIESLIKVLSFKSCQIQP